MSLTSKSLAYAHANRGRFVNELKEFIRFPSVSARPEHTAATFSCAEWLAKHLSGIGLERVHIIPTRGHPLVYGEWLGRAGLPTILIYGHYDVQPAEPLDKWHSPPFDPVVRGQDIYGRGAADDKGQLLSHIKAIESYLFTSGELPVNVKCLFEGEEEIGSPNFDRFLIENREALRADVVLVSDTTMPSRDRPALTYAMRGSLNLELEVSSSKTDLHDGLFGGTVHNPLQGLCEMIACLQSNSGYIQVPGFYDRVRSVSEKERAQLRRCGPTNAELLSDAQVEQEWGETGYTMYERITMRPSLTISGFMGGYQRAGPKAIIPARALAKLNFRLVADQDPYEIESLVRRHISELTPPTLQTTIRTHLAARPVVIDRNHPLIKAAAISYGKGFRREPVFLRSGGTNAAVAAFQHILDLPIALAGFAMPEDRVHAPNEKFHLPNFFRGIASSISYLHDLAVRAARGHRFGASAA